ncbi:MAG: hypothetical protein K8T10_02450 [Candidatus Eremiobacteraeota bacterium]|nr:hypothetical protein [Candidatus Eremiobacteraeota bacterium]
MIKEIVDEIKSAEEKAAGIKKESRESGDEVVRQALKKSDHIKGYIHKERKGIIRTKVEEMEKNGNKRGRVIEKEAEEEAARTQRSAGRFVDEAVNKVFERVLNYGNK